MKKVFVILVAGILFSSLVWAGIEKSSLEIKMSNILSGIKSNADGWKARLTTSRDKAQSYVTNHPAQFDTEDKTKLLGLATEVDKVITALNDLSVYMAGEWSNLE